MKLTALPVRSFAAAFSLTSFLLLPAISIADDSEEEDKPPPTNLERVNVVLQQGGGGDFGGLSALSWSRDVISIHPVSIGGDKAQETEKRDPCGDAGNPGPQSSGNPVVLFTGNKIEIENDFAVGGEMGLRLQRTYNHHWSATGLFGDHWLSNFDYSLVLSNTGEVIWLQRPDGRRLKLGRDPASGRWHDNRQQPLATVAREADGSFTFYNEERGVERYNSQGFITERRNEQGVAWYFIYSNNYLQKVTHSSGRDVQFRWNNGQLTQVIDPAGTAYTYTYTANVFAGQRARLASATLPGTPSTTISYHYEDSRYPGGLTGKSFNGVRYSTFAYDDQRRAILSEHAGGIERYRFNYSVQASEQVVPAPAPVKPGMEIGNPETGWCEYDGRHGYVCYEPHIPQVGRLAGNSNRTMATSSLAGKPRAIKISVTETNPLGRRTTYVYEDGKLKSVSGEQSSHCAAGYKELTYDSNGLPDILSDFQGTLTDHDHDAQGRLVRRVEAAGTPISRTIETQWNPQHRVTRETLLGSWQADYTYDPRGNIASTSMRNLSQLGSPGQVLTTNIHYAYHSNGLKASIKVDGPLASDDITRRFNEQGDLVSVTNGLGHVTTYSAYNALGLPGRIEDPNGAVVEFTYDARGRLLTQRRRIGSGWATQSRTYDGAGNIATETSADGVTTVYAYDAGMRVTRTVRPAGGGIYAWTSFNYDAASNLTRSEVRQRNLPADTAVVGDFDVVHAGLWNWNIVGWACTTGTASPIEVRAFADPGQQLATATANLPSEAAVGQACRSGGAAHRFTIPITLQQRQQLGGRPVSVYGISPLGSSADTRLSGSGAKTIPPANIHGDIAGITHDENWNFFVEGWACSIGVDGSIDVHVYAGGPAGGGGSFVAAGHAGLATDSAVANACQARGSAYRFRVPLDDNARRAFGGRPIHVHGISPFGGANLTIGNSGSFAMPTYTKSAVMGWGLERDTILHGESTTLKAWLKNTGNVTWGTDNYLAWTTGGPFNQAMHLPRPIRPGEEVELSTIVAPLNHNNFTITISYVAAMASNGVAWGPQGHTVLRVLHQEPPGCDFGQDCEPVISSLRNAELKDGGS